MDMTIERYHSQILTQKVLFFICWYLCWYFRELKYKNPTPQTLSRKFSIPALAPKARLKQ